MTTPRYTVAWRPGRVQAWYVVDRLTARTIARCDTPEAARTAALMAALAAEKETTR